MRLTRSNLGPLLRASYDGRRPNRALSTPSGDSTTSSDDQPILSRAVRRPKKQRQRTFNLRSHGLGDHGPTPNTPPARKQRSEEVPTIGTRDENASDQSESDITPPRERRSKRRRKRSLRLEESVESLSDEEFRSDHTTLRPFDDITPRRKANLSLLIDQLLEENDEDSRPFAEPIHAVAEGIPAYHTVIKRAMDLRTLKENLDTGCYSCVADFEADFELIVENSIQFNGLRHEVSQRGLRLLDAFDALLYSLRGQI